MTNLNSKLTSLVAGENYMVPTLNSGEVSYVNLDNAASTPPFKSVIKKVNEFSEVYSSVHRGSGYKSMLCTDIYEKSRRIIGDFIGADLEYSSIIYVRNSTEAINKLASFFQFEEGDVVICSRMEHHSNDLPWRKKASVKYIEVKETGELDIDHYEELLNLYKNKIKLVAITGASNVTGFINPFHQMAQMAHEVGAKILVDGSQLVPHRKVDIKNNQANDHIDFLVFTAHKMYAPFGVAVLVGPKTFFNEAEPFLLGGGMVKMVTDNEMYLDSATERHEAGTQNIFGAVALATAIKTYESIGIGEIENHEYMLTSYLLERIQRIKGIKIYGNTEADRDSRVGVVAFNMEGVNHSLLTSILSYEYGIAVRNGCFCAHPYVLRLLGVGEMALKIYSQQILAGNKTNLPGLIRVSIGIYNTYEHIDRLLIALENISKGKYSHYYIEDTKQGNYVPVNWNIQSEDLFKFF